MTSLANPPATDTPRNVLVGLIGDGIQLSLTPAMHERAGTLNGLNYTYRLFDTEMLKPAEELAAMLDKAEQLGFAGLNITHPYKQAVIGHLDELSADASAIGAVNTVLFRDGKRIGHNTDWFGFAEAFRRDLSDSRCHSVVQLGAGGAGSAVGHALLTLGVENLSISDMAPQKAAQLAQALARRFPQARVTPLSTPDEAMRSADGLVNATPIGMAKYAGVPLPTALLRPDMWVVDIIYFPQETELLRQARALGCRVQNGGGMAVFQAAEAFRLFSGCVADPQRMQDVFTALCATPAEKLTRRNGWPKQAVSAT